MQPENLRTFEVAASENQVRAVFNASWQYTPGTFELPGENGDATKTIEGYSYPIKQQIIVITVTPIKVEAQSRRRSSTQITVRVLNPPPEEEGEELEALDEPRIPLIDSATASVQRVLLGKLQQLEASYRQKTSAS